MCFELLTKIWALASSEQPIVNVENRVFEIGVFELKTSGDEKLTCVVKYVDARAVPLFVPLGRRDCQNLLTVPEFNQAGLGILTTQISLVGVVQVEVIREILVDKADERVRHDRFPHIAWLLMDNFVCHSTLHMGRVQHVQGIAPWWKRVNFATKTTADVSLLLVPCIAHSRH